MDNYPKSTPTTPVGPGGSRWVPDPPDVGSSDGGRLGWFRWVPPPEGGPTHRDPPADPLSDHPSTTKNPTGWDPPRDPPELWPGSDPTRPCAYAEAWRDVWSRVNDSWTPMAEVCDAVAQAQGLKTKTVSGMIRTARDGGHLMIRGRYARKTGTRMIRRHPKAAA